MVTAERVNPYIDRGIDAFATTANNLGAAVVDAAISGLFFEQNSLQNERTGTVGQLSSWLTSRTIVAAPVTEPQLWTDSQIEALFTTNEQYALAA